MKNLYVLLIALSSFSFHHLYAQTSPTFGLRGGLTVATLQGDAMNNLSGLVDLSKGFVTTTSRTGFYGGGYANIPVNEYLSVEPGIYFSQKGYRMKGNLDIKALNFLGANASAELQSSYVDVPLVMRVNLAKGLQVFAGPQVSYLVKNNLQISAGALGLSLFKQNMDVTNNFRKWDAALTGGIAYQFVNGFNIQAGYDYGLSRVDANGNLKSYNNVIKLGVGFSF